MSAFCSIRKLTRGKCPRSQLQCSKVIPCDNKKISTNEEKVFLKGHRLVRNKGYCFLIKAFDNKISYNNSN